MYAIFPLALLVMSSTQFIHKVPAGLSWRAVTVCMTLTGMPAAKQLAHATAKTCPHGHASWEGGRGPGKNA